MNFFFGPHFHYSLLSARVGSSANLYDVHICCEKKRNIREVEHAYLASEILFLYVAFNV